MKTFKEFLNEAKINTIDDDFIYFGKNNTNKLGYNGDRNLKSKFRKRDTYIKTLNDLSKDIQVKFSRQNAFDLKFIPEFTAGYGISFNGPKDDDPVYVEDKMISSKGINPSMFIGDKSKIKSLISFISSKGLDLYVSSSKFRTVTLVNSELDSEWRDIYSSVSLDRASEQKRVDFLNKKIAKWFGNEDFYDVLAIKMITKGDIEVILDNERVNRKYSGYKPFIVEIKDHANKSGGKINYSGGDTNTTTLGSGQMTINSSPLTLTSKLSSFLKSDEIEDVKKYWTSFSNSHTTGYLSIKS